MSTSQGSILDDEALVNTLQSSKKTSEEVKEQLVIAEQTEIKIDSAREVGYIYIHIVEQERWGTYSGASE